MSPLCSESECYFEKYCWHQSSRFSTWEFFHQIWDRNDDCLSHCPQPCDRGQVDSRPNVSDLKIGLEMLSRKQENEHIFIPKCILLVKTSYLIGWGKFSSMMQQDNSGGHIQDTPINTQHLSSVSSNNQKLGIIDLLRRLLERRENDFLTGNARLPCVLPTSGPLRRHGHHVMVWWHRSNGINCLKAHSQLPPSLYVL